MTRFNDARDYMGSRTTLDIERSYSVVGGEFLSIVGREAGGAIHLSAKDAERLRDYLIGRHPLPKPGPTKTKADFPVGSRVKIIGRSLAHGLPIGSFGTVIENPYASSENLRVKGVNSFSDTLTQNVAPASLELVSLPKPTPPAPKHDFKVGDMVRIVGNTVPKHFIAKGLLAKVVSARPTSETITIEGFCDWGHATPRVSTQSVSIADLEKVDEDKLADGAIVYVTGDTAKTRHGFAVGTEVKVDEDGAEDYFEDGQYYVVGRRDGRDVFEYVSIADLSLDKPAPLADWERELLGLAPALKVGDRVKRVGPHLANGGTNYADRECKVGDEGVVKYINGAEVGVKWDAGRTSLIVATSLAKVPAPVLPVFAIGDKVRRVGPHTYSGVDYRDRECKVGDIGTVYGTGGARGAIGVRWEKGNRSYIDAASLEKVVEPELKVGDTVKIIEAEFAERFIGKTGTLSSVTGTERFRGKRHPFIVDGATPSGTRIHAVKVEKVEPERAADYCALCRKSCSSPIRPRTPRPVAPKPIFAKGDRVRVKAGQEEARWFDSGAVAYVKRDYFGGSYLEVEWERSDSRYTHGEDGEWFARRFEKADELKVGDRVMVDYCPGSAWNGPGTVSDVLAYNVHVKSDVIGGPGAFAPRQVSPLNNR